MTHLKSLLALIILIFSLYTSPIWANHLVAGEMRYQATDKPNEYLIGMKLYRNCGGKELCASCPISLSPGCQINLQIDGYEGIYANENFGSASIKIVKHASAQHIQGSCKLNPSTCTNCGTRNPGTFSPGYEVYYFEGIIKLDSVPANCCKVKISYQSCCRNEVLTSLKNPALTNYYQEIMINRCLQSANSAPVYPSDPIYFTCTGTDETLYLGGAIDPDGDSLSYEKTPLLSASGMPVQYFGPYSDSVPFPYFGAPANPQKGIELNPISGNLQFRPMGTFSANMCFRINKWRKVNGSFEIVGFVTREINIHTFYCPNNNPPQIFTYDKNHQLTSPQPSQSFKLNSEEEFCLTLSARDNNASSDTTNITFIGKEILEKLGGKFTPLYNPNTRITVGPKFDSIQFCWSPPTSAIRTEPYYLKVKAADQACPSSAKTSLNIQLTVGIFLGLNQNIDAEKFIQIYPNPATDLLKVELLSPLAEALTLQLFSLNGCLVQTEKIPAKQLSISLKLDQHPRGIYLLKVVGNKVNLNKKINLM
ncbi:MAG: T9SS type A sorting domain-containing protein [bacterium]|nr:T9SS type A sorting domain-containing protein [bacterium]